jgi:hypothetical protein
VCTPPNGGVHTLLKGGKSLIDQIMKAIVGITGSVLEAAMKWFLELLLDQLIQLQDVIMTWWFGTPPMSVGAGSTTDAISLRLMWLYGVVGVVATAFGVVRAVRTREREDSDRIWLGVFRSVFSSGLSVLITYQLLQFSGGFAFWIYYGISGEKATNFKKVINFDAGVGAGLIIFLLIGLGIMMLVSVIQAFLGLGTVIFAQILSAILPVTAAASQTEAGHQAFKKQVSWILACVAFRPAAAIIYGIGVRLAKSGNVAQGANAGDNAQVVGSMVAGLMMLVLAVFALPAMVKLFAPIPSALGGGGGGRFLMAAGTMVATGAAMAATAGASGGASAGASGASAGGGAGGASLTSSVPNTDIGAGGGNIGGSGGGGATGAASGPMSSTGAGSEGSNSNGSESLGLNSSTGSSQGQTIDPDAGSGSAGIGSMSTGVSGGSSVSQNGAEQSPPQSIMGSLTGQTPASSSASVPGGNSGGGFPGAISRMGYAAQDLARAGQEEVSNMVVAEGAEQ